METKRTEGHTHTHTPPEKIKRQKLERDDVKLGRKKDWKRQTEEIEQENGGRKTKPKGRLREKVLPKAHSLCGSAPGLGSRRCLRPHPRPQLTWRTRLVRPVFWASCFKSLASGLWLMAK